jgi:thiosulfate/3-mercaptopyruvate sulfurtransferase
MNDLPYIISAKELAKQLNNPQVIIVDCRFQLADPSWGRQQYEHSHIPGAYYLDLNQDLSSPVQTHGGRHPLPDPEVLASKLETIGGKLGETLVVAYDDTRFAFAARLWWLLRYYGHEQVALLDGGWQAWTEKAYPITTIIPQAISGQFKPQLRKDWIVDLKTLKTKLEQPGVLLLDARDGDRYRGEREPIDPIAGHIPNAVNSPWQAVTDSQGYLRDLEEQEQLWTNYQQAENIIVYCGSGVTACVNILSLTLTGKENVKLYPGGWSDWCSYLI